MDAAMEEEEEFCDLFFRKPALSFKLQPSFEEICKNLADKDDARKFTFVLGAGVSLDAKLPTWAKLVDNICEYIEKPAWKSASKADTAELSRKAESAIQLVTGGDKSLNSGVIKRALYRTASGGQNVSPRPGVLAEQIARLVSLMGDRARVATMNYDTLIETAISTLGDGNANSLHFDPEKSTQEGWPYLPEWHKRAVLHLHGLIPPGGESPKGNIVLTESDFLLHGPSVRDFLERCLIDSHVIFIGVSLTDPNLVSPLWKIQNSRADRPASYVLSVAVPRRGAVDPNAARAFEIKKSSYLSSALGLRTIFFKSYGQQSQAVSELGLTCAYPDNYLNSDPETSLRYGFRLERELTKAYKHLGCGEKLEAPTGDDGSKLSKLLRCYLREQDGIADRLDRELASLQTDNRTHRQEAARTYGNSFRDEKFGLFLWLRFPTSRGDSEYKLKLVGTSVYVHSENWSLTRDAEISETSPWACGRALFYGRTDICDVEPVDSSFKLWRSVRAVPFSHVPSDLFGEIQIGAITLNSNRFTIGNSAHSKCSSCPNETPRECRSYWPGEHRSILSMLSEDTSSAINGMLADIGTRITGSPIDDQLQSLGIT